MELKNEVERKRDMSGGGGGGNGKTTRNGEMAKWRDSKTTRKNAMARPREEELKRETECKNEMMRPREEEWNDETERGRMALLKRKRERRKREGKYTKSPKEGDMNAVVSGNCVRMWDTNAVPTNNLQNNLKIVLQIPTWLFP